MNFYESLIRIKKNPIPLEKILIMCLNGSGYGVQDAKSKSRKRDLVYIRQAFCLVCLNLSERLDYKSVTVTSIGKFIKRNHSSVLHAKKNSHYQEIKEIVNRVLKNLEDEKKI